MEDDNDFAEWVVNLWPEEFIRFIEYYLSEEDKDEDEDMHSM